MIGEELTNVALELTVESRHPNSASIDVGWCLLPGVANVLTQRKAANPHVLLVVTDPRGREKRELVPIDVGMYVLTFNASGQNKVQAMIVWDADGIKALKKRFTRRDGGKYVTDVAVEGGALFRDMGNTMGYSAIEVTVDQKHFARKPPAWLLSFVNLWYEGPLWDQCHFRKRLLISILPKIVLLPVYYVLKFTVFLLIALYWTLFRGKGGVNYRPVFMLIDSELEDIYRKVRFGKSFWANLWTWQFHPVVFIAASFVWMIGFTPDEKTHKPEFILFHTPTEYALYYLGVVAGLYVATILVAIGMMLFPAIGNTFDKFVEKENEAARQRSIRETQAFERSLSHLVCAHDEIPPPVTFARAPRKTFRLVFLEAKKFLCKPYAS